MLGLAMVGRGEIAFLIASTAESKGIFDDSQVYLVVVWAAVLCTIVGPIGVGSLVRRVKTLQKERKALGASGDILGIWGVAPQISPSDLAGESTSHGQLTELGEGAGRA